MATFVEILAAIIVVTLAALFVPYYYSIWRLPSGRRPLTPEFDRLGRRIGVEENPDYTEEEPDDEQEREAGG